jgi:hypothetical protein
LIMNMMVCYRVEESTIRQQESHYQRAALLDTRARQFQQLPLGCNIKFGVQEE